MPAHLCALQGLSTIVSATDHLLRRWAFAATLLGATAAGLAPRAAAQVNVTITADNGYSFGYGTQNAISTLHGNVNNSSPAAIFSCIGGPELYSNIPSPAGSYLYIIAWSDNQGSQGVLGQFVPVANPNGTVVYTGTSGWQVFATGTDIAGPTLADINTQIGRANTCTGLAGSSGGWVGLANNPACTTGVLANAAPSGTFPPVCSTGPNAISPNAKWMWYNPSSSTISNPFVGNVAGEYLIFRLPTEQVTNPKRVIVNKDIQNTSGQAVAGVEILIAGQPAGIHDIFHGSTPTFSVTPSGADTLLRWTGGNIPANGIFHVGFNMPQQSVEILGMWLIDSLGNRVGCARQCNSNLHLYGFGGDITYKNSVTACAGTTLYCGQMAIEWHANEVDLALLNGTSPRFPLRIDTLPTAPVVVAPGASVTVPIILPTPPAGATYVVFSYVVGTTPALTGPVTRDWIEWTVDQLSGGAASHLIYGTGCHAPTPMTLSAAPTPVINPSTVVTYTASNLQEFLPFSGIYLSTMFLSLNPNPGGFDLAGILTTVPGCKAWILTLDLDLGAQVTFSPTATWNFTFDNVTFALGNSVAAQAVGLFDPSFPLPNGESGGFLLSNGVLSTTATY